MNKQRNPITAFILSFLVPGLGQIYNGQLKLGLVLSGLFYGIYAMLLKSQLINSFSGLIIFLCFNLAMQLGYSIHAAKVAKIKRDYVLKKYNKLKFYFLIIIAVGMIQTLLYEIKDYKSYNIPTSSTLPVIHINDTIMAAKEPYTKEYYSRGDLVIFKYPEDPSIEFVKRIIGTPGDKISINGNEIIVNGKKLEIKKIKDFSYVSTTGGKIETEWYEETIANGVSYPILFTKGFNIGYIKCRNIDLSEPSKGNFCDTEFTVSEDSVFVLGDNRDNSSDSRHWGFVDTKLIIGKPLYVWFSKDFKRIGKVLK